MTKEKWDLRKVLSEIQDDPQNYHETDVAVDQMRN